MLKILKQTNTNWKTTPKLDLERYVGSSDYIDFITPEMMSESIMTGYDVYNRQFLALKLDIEIVKKKHKYDFGKEKDKDDEKKDDENNDDEKEDDDNFNKIGYKMQVVETFFERYSNDDKNLAFGCVNYTPMLYNDSRVRDYDWDNLLKRLKLLFDGNSLYNIDSWTIQNPSDSIIGNSNILFKLSK